MNNACILLSAVILKTHPSTVLCKKKCTLPVINSTLSGVHIIPRENASKASLSSLKLSFLIIFSL